MLSVAQDNLAMARGIKDQLDGIADNVSSIALQMSGSSRRANSGANSSSGGFGAAGRRSSPRVYSPSAPGDQTAASVRRRGSWTLAAAVSRQTSRHRFARIRTPMNLQFLCRMNSLTTTCRGRGTGSPMSSPRTAPMSATSCVMPR